MRPLFTVITPAESRALTTLDRVRAAWGFEDASETLIADLIEAASASIAAYLNAPADGIVPPTLAREVCEDVFYLDAPAAALPLSRWPVDVVTEVEEDGATIEPFLADTTVNPAFVYETDRAAALLFKRSGFGRTAFGANRVRVRYAAGYVTPGTVTEGQTKTLPANLEDCCVRLVGRLLQQLAEADDPRVTSESIPGLGAWQFELQKISWEGGISSDVRDGLQLYRRRNV